MKKIFNFTPKLRFPPCFQLKSGLLFHNDGDCFEVICILNPNEILGIWPNDNYIEKPILYNIKNKLYGFIGNNVMDASYDWWVNTREMLIVKDLIRHHTEEK